MLLQALLSPKAASTRLQRSTWSEARQVSLAAFRASASRASETQDGAGLSVLSALALSASLPGPTASVAVPARLASCCVSPCLSTYSGVTVTVSVIATEAPWSMVVVVPVTPGKSPAEAFSESLLSALHDTS